MAEVFRALAAALSYNSARPAQMRSARGRAARRNRTPQHRFRRTPAIPGGRMTRHIPHRIAPVAPLALLLALSLLSSPAAAAILEISGPAGASVTVDGRPLGFLPLAAPLELAPGRHLVVCELYGHKRFEQEVQLVDPDETVRLAVRPTPFSRRTAVAGNLLFAGLGHFHMERDTRGWIYAGAEAGGLIMAAIGESRRSNAKADHLLLMDQYRAALNADEVVRLRLAADDKYQEMIDGEDMRDTGLIIAGAAIAVSMLDALITFPAIEAGAGPAPPQQAGLDRTTEFAEMATSFHAGVRLSF
jgi:hypothetical protein